MKFSFFLAFMPITLPLVSNHDSVHSVRLPFSIARGWREGIEVLGLYCSFSTSCLKFSNLEIEPLKNVPGSPKLLVTLLQQRSKRVFMCEGQCSDARWDHSAMTERPGFDLFSLKSLELQWEGVGALCSVSQTQNMILLFCGWCICK